jgi:hypothetical protein
MDEEFVLIFVFSKDEEFVLIFVFSKDEIVGKFKEFIFMLNCRNLGEFN